MEKKYIRKPFDVELARKIQSGEIEGRIVTEIGTILHIITFDFKKKGYPILAYSERIDGNINIHFISEIGFQKSLNCCGYVDDVRMLPDFEVIKNDSQLLYIELPEEEPKHDSFNKKLHDTAEVLATPKYEFKVGDIVKVVRGDKEVGCVGSLYAPMYSGQAHIIGWIVIVEKGRRANGILVENLEPASEKEIEIYKNTKVELEREFRPFEQVLVREERVWVPRLYGYSEYKHLSDRDETFHIMTDGKTYLECIPFKGNEHLVDTTNNPE